MFKNMKNTWQIFLDGGRYGTQAPVILEGLL